MFFFLNINDKSHFRAIARKNYFPAIEIQYRNCVPNIRVGIYTIKLVNYLVSYFTHSEFWIYIWICTCRCNISLKLQYLYISYNFNFCLDTSKFGALNNPEIRLALPTKSLTKIPSDTGNLRQASEKRKTGIHETWVKFYPSVISLFSNILDIYTLLWSP